MRSVVVLKAAVICATLAVGGGGELAASPSPALAGGAPIGAAVRARKDVSEALEEIRAKHKVPALGAVAFRVGAATEENPAGIIAQGVCGVREAGSQTKVTIDDNWHIGSCTKAMTATLCAALVEEGKLKWASTLGDVLGKEIEGTPAHYASITLEQLLTHTSGLPANVKPLKFRDGVAFSLSEARSSAISQAVALEPVGAAGENYAYSNVGYIVAGHMAEVVAGKPYEELMRERLFGPLRMDSAGFGAPGIAGPGEPDQPRGHHRGKAVPPGPSADNPQVYAPAGTVHCTMEDWAKFAIEHMRGERAAKGEMEEAGEGAPSTLKLKAETWARLHAPSGVTKETGSPYAMGWIVTERPWAGDGPVLTHGGSNTMWHAVIWLGPANDIGVIAVCNAAGDAAVKATDEACAMLIGRLARSEKGETRDGE